MRAGPTAEPAGMACLVHLPGRAIKVQTSELTIRYLLMVATKMILERPHEYLEGQW